MKNLLLPCPAANGFHRILAPGECEMSLTGFSLLKLADGATYQGRGEGVETALVFLGGRATVRGAGFEFANVGGRKDVFSGLPHTVYLPPESEYEIEALGEVEIAVAESPASLRGVPALIGPESVKTLTLGRDNFQRDAVIMVDEHFPAEHLFIGEAFVPPGNWGSFPPHRHDHDNPPVELDMEEIYFFRFNPPGGFGIQKIYTDDRSIDVAYTVTNNDTVAIPRGYHPVVNAPGYAMYFLWIMAGRSRGFINVKESAHAWIK